MSDPTCAYAGCDAAARVERRYTDTGGVFDYCSDHDPLNDDSPVQDVFEEVEE